LNYQKKIILLIIISSSVRIIIANSLELSNAEVYYWVYSLHLQWNYFDHPPIIAWLIRITTANLLLHNEFFVRFGAIIASAICTWLIFKIGTLIHNVQTGWIVALLYTSSIYCSIGAGTFILPDSPQMIFWLWSILVLIKILHSGIYNQKSTLLWCMFGLTSGLCIMSKVPGIFLWFGIVLYALTINRKWLKQPGIYLSVIITLIIISPIIIWNLQNHFITYQSYSTRITLAGARINVSRFIKELFAVIIITNPVNFFLICSNLLLAFKGKIPADKKDIQLLLFCSLPLIVITLFISLLRETLPHWPGPAYSSLLILPAIKLSSAIKDKRYVVPKSIKIAIIFMIMTAVLEIFITNFFPGNLSGQKKGLDLGSGDPTLNMYGWKEAGKKFDSLYRSDTAKGIMQPKSPIIVNKWFPAAHIDFYIAAITKQQTLGLGDILNLGQYYWLNKYKKQLKNGDSAYYIVPSNLFDYKSFEEIINSFAHYEMALVIYQLRSGIICKELYIFRLKGYLREKH
jgi:hypothetical protein